MRYLSDACCASGAKNFYYISLIRDVSLVYFVRSLHRHILYKHQFTIYFSKLSQKATRTWKFMLTCASYWVVTGVQSIGKSACKGNVSSSWNLRSNAMMNSLRFSWACGTRWYHSELCPNCTLAPKIVMPWSGKNPSALRSMLPIWVQVLKKSRTHQSGCAKAIKLFDTAS